MKALEILKSVYYKEEGVDEWIIPSEMFSEGNKRIQEAIAELEALQANYEAQEIIIADLHKELEAANESYLLLLKSYHETTSPKTCDGCEYENEDNPCILYKAGLHCSRFPYAKVDRYQPKEPK